ncbi:MAG TPA: serine/threonine-protein kinase, partial [Anaerolineales bacterium]|nr:serine/threonine-protein kinase [Anaerolineales bacterium]
MRLTKIGRYEVIRELGQGGMATVFHARDPRFKRDVAVKVLPKEFLHTKHLKARFERESQTIASLEHQAIVPVYDAGTHEGQPYLVMRFMAGGSLAARLSRGPLSIQEAAHVLYRIGSALDFAHSEGVIHRDLKPANVLFDRFGESFLSDFGIAMLEEATLSLTKTGSIIGTPAY